ncbi:MAG: HAD family hydrolase [Pseudomonadota bacterium]
MRLAVWSGPRNLSTALMYSFGARADCTVWDEPFYAPYLAATGIDHPMAAEVLANHDVDPASVAERCAAPAPTALIYQKHMAHHLLPEFPTEWMAACTHVLLLRHPARVLASYHERRHDPVLADIGAADLERVAVLVERATGRPPVIIDSADIRRAPAPALSALCAAVGLVYDPAMLTWPKGGNAADGVWAAHWYAAVHASTGFAPAEGPLPPLPDRLTDVLVEALPHYEALHARALRID